MMPPTPESVEDVEKALKMADSLYGNAPLSYPQVLASEVRRLRAITDEMARALEKITHHHELDERARIVIGCGEVVNEAKAALSRARGKDVLP